MITLSSRDRLEAACERAAAARLHQLPLLRAATDGKHALALISAPDVNWPARVSKHLGAQVVLVGDDPWPAGVSLGPDGWACLRGARRWARLVVVHGTGSALEHYRLASALAVVHRNLLFVETDSGHVAEWASRFSCPVLRFVPPAGHAHPEPSAEVMQ